jgi:hypothetical protein
MTNLTYDQLEPGHMYKAKDKIALREKPTTDSDVKFRLESTDPFMFLDSTLDEQRNIAFLELLGPTNKGWLVVVPTADLFQENLEIPETSSTHTVGSNPNE